MNFAIIASLLAISTEGKILTPGNFDYHSRGPTTWWFFYPNQCDELIFPQQSPVRLDQDDWHSFQTSKLPKLDLYGLGNRPSTIQLINDGTGLSINPQYSNFEDCPTLSGGPLVPGRRYSLHHIDFHWGNQANGSEHKIGDNGTSAEVQFNFYDASRFESYKEALLVQGGVVIVSTLAKQTETVSQSSFDEILKILPKIEKARHRVTLKYNLFSLLPFMGTFGNYFSYYGSLTKPPCITTVTWIVLQNGIEFPRSFLDGLQRLQDVNGRQIDNNCRPIQKLAGRKIMKVLQKEDL